MRRFAGSLLGRTLAVFVGALILSQVTALWLYDAYVTEPRVALTVRQFVNHLRTLATALETMGPGERERFAARVSERDGIRIAAGLAAGDMRPAPDRPALRLFRDRIRDQFGPTAEVYVRGERGERGERGRPRVFWVRMPAGEREYWIGFPRGRIERDPVFAFAVWSLVGLAVAILATFLLTWRMNRPLGELARAAEKLGKGGEPEPVSETGPTEIRAVARAFNQMKDDLRRAERERATFLAGVSHDLRTPLTRLRLDVEMLEGKVDAAVQRGMVSDLEDMNAIIDQFIDFMRSEAAEPLAPVDLSALARACAERAARSGVAVRCELAGLPWLMLRPIAVQRMVDNLVANAARHAGGEIVLRTTVAGRSITLSVLDRGPGIPPELVEQLKQPFTRRDSARSGASGAGLGLAIADRVARLHGGRLDLLPREGGGLEARITLEGAKAPRGA